MPKKKVVLLGASNSLIKNGLCSGLRENDEFDIINLALGASSCTQNLYEAVRNRRILEEAELIITESNVVDINLSGDASMNFTLELFYRNVNWLYAYLYFLNKKILCLILPRFATNYKIINNIHRKLALKYGFNVIDLHKYYEENNLQEFHHRMDSVHPQAGIMRELGKSIINNFALYKEPLDLDIKNDNPVFSIVTPQDMKLEKGSLECIERKNSFFNETAFRLTKETRLGFPYWCKGYYLIAAHTWNASDEKGEFGLELSRKTMSQIGIYNTTMRCIHQVNSLNTFFEIQNNSFLLDEESFLSGYENDETMKIYPTWTHKEAKATIEYCDCIAFFLAKDGGNFYNEKIDFKDLEDENVQIEQGYDFYDIIPSIRVYKELIDEYCALFIPRHTHHLRHSIALLQNELSLLKPKASQRIQSYLCYKLGFAMVHNSKGILNRLKLPFLLMAIALEHKAKQQRYKESIAKNPALKLPALETLPDYKEALEIKEHLSYKLGKTFLQRYKNKWGGGNCEIPCV
ncbi:hypothetical protein OQH60_07280 [Campylobacter sp. MIT 21-1685]|uniref:hypothetical protein n=1 Tax=Campylobacter sp. MIT 21-1685 TaxID=2994323 RepID=UPI00224A60E3|nr:hypothetical protein [Campylobacter sp. MIT 21-1685]MCX2808146.1 hypothetical protein [Campylobacter sp. MIT 21-1685]